VYEDQMKFIEKRVREKREMSETPKQSKSETPKKRETHERKICGLLKVNEVKKLLLSSKPLYLLYCKNNTLVVDHSNQINFLPSVNSLLQEFKDVFPNVIPRGLPPLRGIEHHIDLLPRASLLNRPATKSNPQETKKIQIQVEELMNKGWVQESMSPCVVPAILVPKKDGSWRMCTNCRAQNNITIKYKHPIPRLDDLLDELYGACIF